jgi:hypothetical protein
MDWLLALFDIISDLDAGIDPMTAVVVVALALAGAITVTVWSLRDASERGLSI